MENERMEEAGVVQVSSRPEDMIPYVREYLGLKDDQKGIDVELKRLFDDYKKQRTRLLERKRPIDTRLDFLETHLKQMIHTQNLRGVRYKQYIVALEEKPLFKPQMDKIIDALENNPIEQYSHDKKTLARIIADAVKKKCKLATATNKNDLSKFCIRIRHTPT